MKFDADIHHRRSIRLKGHDYSSPAAYFVTLCAQNRELLFGHIRDVEMSANEAGEMIIEWWKKIPDRFINTTIDEYILMPNHMHGIIEIVGAAPCGRPNNTGGQPHGVAPTLGDMMNWFKTMTTNEYIKNVHNNGWPPFDRRLWQRNYYEHIIRTGEELNKYRGYIRDNPVKWPEDEENPENIKNIHDQ